MQIKLKSGRIDLIEDEAILLSCFEDDHFSISLPKTINNKLWGAIRQLFDTGDFVGKLGQTAVLYPQGRLKSKRIILTGLGKRDEITTEKIRRAYGFAGRTVREHKVKSLSTPTFDADHSGIELPLATRAMVEGLLLSNYKLDRYKTGEENQKSVLKNTTIVEIDNEKMTEIKKGMEEIEVGS